MTEFTIGDICKEVQRIQFDLEVRRDVESAVDRCKNLDNLLCEIEEGKHSLVIEWLKNVSVSKSDKYVANNSNNLKKQYNTIIET